MKPGDVITDGLFNALLEAAEACGLTVAQGSSLKMSEGPHGRVLASVVPKFLYAKITGAISGGTYPWTEQFPAASGGWTAGSVTGVAYEDNGNTAVAVNTYVKMWWTVAGEWRFLAGTC